jgi:hypothetical protein
MRGRTLIADRLYYGLSPVRLRAATTRALARVVGLSSERARVTAASLRQDFAVDTVQGEAIVKELVADGLLDPPSERQAGYAFTQEFMELAGARIVEPLPRARAKQLLSDACALAERINEEDVHNPLVVAAFAVFGDYMSRQHMLGDLSLGVVVDLRPVSRRMRFGRMLRKQEGAESIKAAFRGLSSFVRVRLVTDVRTLPRPFSLVFEARG